MVYGESELEALNKVKALALHFIADQIEAGEFELLENLAFVSQQAA